LLDFSQNDFERKIGEIMTCKNCGSDFVGKFCGQCGAANEKAKFRFPLFGIISIAVAVFLMAPTVYVAIDQDAMFRQFTAESESAYANADDATTLAASLNTELISAQASKSACLYNYFCSLITYNGWSDTVAELETSIANAQADASSWTETGDTNLLFAEKADSNRLAAMTAFAIEFVLLAVYLVIALVSRNRRKKA
jgi:hypothetical protein